MYDDAGCEHCARNLCRLCENYKVPILNFEINVFLKKHRSIDSVAEWSKALASGASPIDPTKMDSPGFEPGTLRMRSGCDTTTPQARDICASKAQNLKFVLFGMRYKIPLPVYTSDFEFVPDANIDIQRLETSCRVLLF